MIRNAQICRPCWYAPLIITAQELEEYLSILDEVLTWVDKTYLK